MEIKRTGDWQDVLNAARNTVNKPITDTSASDVFKRKMIMSEHSPIRLLTYSWTWNGIKSWVSQHIARHNKFAEHFVSTQRTDRTGINRDELRQDEPVNHMMATNAQEIIAISRKRLCILNPSKETQKAWQEVVDNLRNTDPILADACVPDCIYRGHCYEIKTCNYHKTDMFKKNLEKYRDGINQ
jgi:hypothetical protein